MFKPGDIALYHDDNSIRARNFPGTLGAKLYDEGKLARLCLCVQVHLEDDGSIRWVAVIISGQAPQIIRVRPWGLTLVE